MVIDVQFRRGTTTLSESNIVLLPDRAASFDLADGRTKLAVNIWLDQEGLVFIAGPVMNRNLTHRWRSVSTNANRWHQARLYSLGRGQPWQCRYRIFQESERQRSRLMPR